MLRASVVNNTVVSNDSVGIAGMVLAAGEGVGYPSPSGIVSEPTSSALLAQIGSAGLKAANAISQPTELSNNIVWRNRSFYYSGNGRLCVGNSRAEATGACSTLPDQGATGQCVPGAKYWDLGVLGDASTAPGAQHLKPTYSILTSTAGYTGKGNTASDPGLVEPYCNGSRVMPELGTVINPPSVLNLQVAATADEGNNYVNLRYGPLFVENPANGTTFGDYHISGTASPAYNAGTEDDAPNHDVDGQPRPFDRLFDIGADELVR